MNVQFYQLQHQKYKMVYLEQLRLLFILFMAFFSYRRLANAAFQALPQCDDSIDQQESFDNQNSQLESESVVEDIEGEAQNYEKAELVVEEANQVEEKSDQICANTIPLPTFAPEIVELEEDGSNVLGEVDDNDSVAKISKRKLIKKSWRKDKKESTTQTIIASEEKVESGVDDGKENEMIDI